jgi:glycosyltransferase involved in cell wall biosynthesis
MPHPPIKNPHKMKNKITIITPAICRTGGGVSEVARLQAQALKNHGLDIEVLTFETPYYELDKHQWGNIDIKKFKIFGPKKFSFSIGLILYLIKNHPQIIHIHGLWMSHCLAAFIAKIYCKSRIIITPHGMLEAWIMKRSKGMKSLVGALYQKSLINNADSIQALTEKEVLDISENTINKKILIIPNFAPEITKTSERPSWLTAKIEGKFIFLYLARIDDKKGWRQLCLAWKEACLISPKFSNNSQLVLCGWKDNCTGFDATIKSIAEETKNLVYAGPQYNENKISSLSSATVFILPSFSEGLPMGVLEAWKLGIPVAMTDECNLPIAFRKGAAFRIETDTSRLSKQLIEISNSSIEDLQVMGSKGKEIANKFFSASKITESLLQAYGLVSTPANKGIYA